MKLILVFMLMTSGWVSVAGRLSDAVKRTSFESEASFRYKLQAGQGDAFQFMYRNKLVYSPYRNLKWTFGFGTNVDHLTSKYVTLEAQENRGGIVGIDTLNVELNLLSSRLKVRSGLMEMPYYRGVSNDVLFDSDLRLKGLHLAYSIKNRRSKYKVDVDASLLNAGGSVVLASLQAQLAKRLMRQAVIVGSGVHGFLGRSGSEGYLKDFLSNDGSLDSFAEVFAKVGLREFPVIVYGSLLVNGLLRANEKLLESSNLNYFAGLEYKFNNKISVNYAFADLQKNLTYASHLMDSNIVNDVLNAQQADLQAHSLSVSYKLKNNQMLKGQLVLHQLPEVSEEAKSTAYISWIAPF